ncbi:MAG: hypothetical protein IJ383_07590 [Bacteroidales bacterium]|nr:hypothetical protein [Bacteroidales bacterium]
MDKIFGAIAADVIDSTSLSRTDLFHLNEEVNRCFADAKNHTSIQFWGRLVRGDTIECCLQNPSMALRLALLIKCRIKAWAGELICSEALQNMGVRFSIGVGNMRIIDRQMDIMDGEAIYVAGRNLNKIASTSLTSAFGFNSDDRNLARLIDISIALLDDLINTLSAKQSVVIYHMLLGLNQTEISRILFISQSSVNSRAQKAGWRLIMDTLRVYESINFMDYVV